ncbi:MAG: hypothetical protein AAF414_18700 [Pseudomonadota bacterium]
MTIIRTALTVLSVWLVTATAWAQDAAPNLVGVWDVELDELVFTNGNRFDAHTYIATLTITEHVGGVVHALYSFTTEMEGLHDGVMEVSARDAEVLGIVSLSGDEIIFINRNEADEAVSHARLISPNEMEIMGYELGEHAWVSRSRAVRR